MLDSDSLLLMYFFSFTVSLLTVEGNAVKFILVFPLPHFDSTVENKLYCQGKTEIFC